MYMVLLAIHLISLATTMLLLVIYRQAGMLYIDTSVLCLSFSCKYNTLDTQFGSRMHGVKCFPWGGWGVLSLFMKNVLGISQNPQNDPNIIKIGSLLVKLEMESVLGVPGWKGSPRRGSRGRQIWTPSFSNNFTPNEPKQTIKSILALKSYGSWLYDMLYHWWRRQLISLWHYLTWTFDLYILHIPYVLYNTVNQIYVILFQSSCQTIWFVCLAVCRFNMGLSIKML